MAGTKQKRTKEMQVQRPRGEEGGTRWGRRSFNVSWLLGPSKRASLSFPEYLTKKSDLDLKKGGCVLIFVVFETHWT